MKNAELKKLLIEECIRRHRATAEIYKASMEEAQQSANEYGNPEDWFDSYKSDLLNKRDLLSRQLSKVLDEIQILENIDTTKTHHQVSFGSIVKTNDINMFISVGLGKVEVGKESFFVISPSVPIYSAIRDKKKGESYEFRGKKCLITDII
jgi:hypothetical protein